MSNIKQITASNQDYVFVKVRPETGNSMETHNGSVATNYYITSSVGQQFVTTNWFGRIKIKIDVLTAGKVRLILYNSPSKTKIFYENEFEFTTLGSAVLHMSFDPLPPGNYYWELVKLSGSIGVSVITDSILLKAYKEGSSTSDWDIESKIMYVANTEEERAIAVVGDEVDGGVTTVSSGSQLGRVVTGIVEKNISREGDDLANGGKILTGAWFVEMED